ncbi:MAG TPA: MgtC/SapB family protein [bacterium]|nr:MgtC/SapB family protein [bacterium]
MSPELEFFLRVLTGTLLGSVIGLERQWRQRFAGLRTNALVAAGAAGFAGLAVAPAALGNPAPIIGQIITGIGFLGAGVIFKEGFNVTGLNTAATVWCSAAVGSLSGCGMPLQALSLAVVVLGINVGLRSVARHLSQAPADASAEMQSLYRLQIVCKIRYETGLRAQLRQEAEDNLLTIKDLRSDPAGKGQIRLSADLVMAGRDDRRMGDVAARLGLERGAGSVHWNLLSSATHFE